MIMKDLCMTDSAYQLVVDPNKMNIKYWVLETGRGRDDICEDFDWLVDLIRGKGKDTPRMLVFFVKLTTSLMYLNLWLQHLVSRHM